MKRERREALIGLMTPPPFIVLEKDGSEENLEFYIGDKLVHSCNHDEHGWAGMEAATNLFEVTAKTLGATFERR
jgi:hypothetical protein